jgi:hypothetical protein
MPSSATITAFYTFVANTKARASQTNHNFDILRGHIIPIDPNTQTSSDSTYDLGSTEYKWNYIHANYLRLKTISGATTSASEGQVAFSSNIGDFIIGNTAVSSHVTGSTLTIVGIGRPMEIGLTQVGLTTGSNQILISAATSASYFFSVWLINNGVTTTSQILEMNSNGVFMSYSPSSIKFMDFPSAGTNVYSISVRCVGVNISRILNSKLYAFEK